MLGLVRIATAEAPEGRTAQERLHLGSRAVKLGIKRL
jgi:hypothetical protein